MSQTKQDIVNKYIRNQGIKMIRSMNVGSWVKTTAAIILDGGVDFEND